MVDATVPMTVASMGDLMVDQSAYSSVVMMVDE